jgi:hypothetical protein
MNELETERRLRDWLVTQAPTVVPDGLRRDVAAIPVAVPVGWPDRLAATLGWGRAAVPRAAWALLLLAGLLAALVGATLLVGSQQERRLPAVVSPVGQLYTCPPGSTPDKPGPVDQARPPAEKLERSAMALDRRAGRLVALTNADGVETWTFDLCTNTWAQMHPDREPASFGWGQLVYDIDSDTTILFSNDLAWAAPGKVWAYDLQVDAWTERGPAPTLDPVFLAYDPVSGLVVAAEHSDRKLMWTYDVATDTWTPIHQANAGPDHAAITYDASVDRILAYRDEFFTDAGERTYETWLFDLRSGTWSRSAAERPNVVGWLVSPGLVYDEAAERTVIFRRGPLTAYGARTDRWEILAAARAVGPTWMAYDPVNRRLVGWGDKTWGPTGAVEALDLVTDEWTVLLEPSQPLAPSTK